MTPPIFISTLQLNSATSPWVVVIVALAAAAAAVHFYRPQASSNGAGVGLIALLRLLALSMVAIMLMAPARVWTYQRHTRGPLYLVLDDSRSMSRTDPGQTKSRAALAEEALNHLRPDIDQFDVTVVKLSRPELITPPPGTWFGTARDILRRPQATETPIGRALDQVAQLAGQSSTVLLISDGRQNAGALPETSAHRLAGGSSRVFALSVGSPQVVRDAAVDSIDAPAFVVAGDNLTIAAGTRLDAITTPVTASLVGDGQLVQTKTITSDSGGHVEFTVVAPPPGEHTYTVSLASVPNEATTRNNQLSAKVSVRREKVRVLLVEDEPRWEYQFLKTALQLDPSIDLQSRLVQHARIEQIPLPPSETIPVTEQTWSAFDVVILGDVSPATLSPDAQAGLVAALGKGRPKSFIAIAGPRNMPGRYSGMPLAAVLPVDLSRTPRPSSASAGIAPRFAPEAQESSMVRLLPDEQINQAYWSAFPAFFWHDEHTTPKPAARILWESTNESPAQSRVPLLTQMAYGSGRVLCLASPETWRLRYVQAASGEVQDLHRRFWSQALRWAVAGDSANSDGGERDVEERNLSADPELLNALAKAGNGMSFDVTDAQKLAAALPVIDHVPNETTRLGLFEDPGRPGTRMLHWVVFLLFVAVITTEWVVRKRRGLV